MAYTNMRVRITRDGVLFVAGLLGVAHETLIANSERVSLLFLFGGMMGLPAFLNKDEKNQQKEKADDERTPPAAS